MSSYSRFLLVLAIVASLAVVAVQISFAAFPYDLANDFAPTAVNGQWSYLRLPPDAWIPAPYAHTTAVTNPALPGLEAFGSNVTAGDMSHNWGVFYHNTTDAELVVPGTTGDWAWGCGDGLKLLPNEVVSWISYWGTYNFSDANYNLTYRNIARWTSDISGAISIDAAFRQVALGGNQNHGKMEIVHKTASGSKTVLWAGQFNQATPPGDPYDTRKTFTGEVTVAAGDYIDFEMIGTSFVGVQGTINPVPEPGSLVALIGGLASVAGFAVRRRK